MNTMPRVMDDTFHRLLWITLVAVAFTFIVILTSVFVDIDDLLAKRDSPVLKQQVVTEVQRTDLPPEFEDDFQGNVSNEDDSDENDSNFRTKRSLESNTYLHRIKNPKMKKNLTNRLATLLEELDEEETSKANNKEKVVANLRDHNPLNPTYASKEENLQEKEITPITEDPNYEKFRNEITYNDVLHLAMHNILLEGIIGHTDINDVYRKIHLLIKSFETNDGRKPEEISEVNLNKREPMELMKIITHDSHKQEDKFFNELVKCEKLQKQISTLSQHLKYAEKKEAIKDAKMLIKTTIEITNNKDNENLKNSNENKTDAVRLIYNGRVMKSVDTTYDKIIENDAVQNVRNKDIIVDGQNINEPELNQAIADYLKTHFIKFYNKYNVIAKGSFISKRLKRQIKIHYLDDQATTEKSKEVKEKPKHHDDELYVEIETHFDGKGTKGEKKKKLVRTLIDKIQKAINTNVDVFDQNKTVKQKHLQIKKRTQNPIDHDSLIENTKSTTHVIEHRNLNPISKTVNIIQPITSVLDKAGDTWKKIYNGPGFLTASKSLNSAEMRELDIDYNSVLKNGIPKRLQKPINTENEDIIKSNEYSDMGNMTLFIKDINGSGFSIGINQYVDEPPDKESLKMFTGLENLIQTYHEQYDQSVELSNESEEHLHYTKDTEHVIQRRDINIPTKFNRPWDPVDRIINKQKNQVNRLPLFQNNGYKHAGINVKLFSNLKSKTKLNKFINTNAMATKKIIKSSKRNKRQLDKIRIVASDHYRLPSKEDIVLVSRENIYADRAVVREEETPEVEIGDKSDDHYDFIVPYNYNMDFPNLQPAYLSTTYDTKSWHTGLMSKYPHIFLDNISKAKELTKTNPSNTMEEKNYHNVNEVRTLNDDKSNENNISSANVDKIINAILPSRSNFKVVVKVFPKNETNIGPGYKEVHTLINKSYDKNGVRYISSLNVSELSKFESLNNTKKVKNPTTINNSYLERQQDQINLLLKLHKERIDQQLTHLKMESHKLEQMIGRENLNKSISSLRDIIKELDQKSSYERPHLNKKNTDISVTTISNTVLHESKTTMKTEYTTINKEDPDKVNILNSIKENENITREILHKIDKNTDILQSFLLKFLGRTQSTPRLADAEKVSINETLKNLEKERLIYPITEELRGNFTNAIPFIYTFQHQFPENKDKLFKTNMIYHGHIHADKVEDGKKNELLKKEKNNIEIENKNTNNNGNESRFFIDELENDFKLVSNDNNRLPVITPINTNITNN